MKTIHLLFFIVFLFHSLLLPDEVQEIFTNIYDTHFWAGPSISGGGSSLQQTQIIRKEIPKLLEEINAKTMLDAPCGDFFWMKEVNLDFLTYYIGGDIVPKLIEEVQAKYGNLKRRFVHQNIILDALPQVDIIFCRDCLVHLSNTDIVTALKNFKKSKSTYLLTTCFPETKNNKDIKTGSWHAVNLELPPFNFPKPITLINEGGFTRYKDKSLGLWKLKDIAIE